jgi:hypothetical protein
MASPRSLPDVITLADPRPGTVAELAPGSRLRVRLRPGLGPTRWHVVDCPGNLLALGREECDLSFLVFGGAPATLRLERRHPRSEIASEVCELLIQVGEAA